MKPIRSLGVVLCSLALVMATSLFAQTAQDGIAKVVNIKGNARFMATAGGTWQPLKSGAILKPGAIIQTAEHSFVDIVLNNADARTVPSAAPTPMNSGGGSSAQPAVTQDAIRLFENTVLGID